MQNAAEMGAYLLGRLEEMQQKHPNVGEVRGKGLMIGLEIVQDRDTHSPAKELRDAIINSAFTRGLLLLGAGQSVIRLMPPLMIDRAIADEALLILEDAFTAAETA